MLVKKQSSKTPTFSHKHHGSISQASWTDGKYGLEDLKNKGINTSIPSAKRVLPKIPFGIKIPAQNNKIPKE